MSSSAMKNTKWVWPMKPLDITGGQNSEVTWKKCYLRSMINNNNLWYISYMHIHMTFIYFRGHFDLRGHCRMLVVKTLYWEHALTTRVMDLIVWMYTLMTIRKMFGYSSLISEVIRGHYRSNWSHSLTTLTGEILASILILPLKVTEAM